MDALNERPWPAWGTDAALEYCRRANAGGPGRMRLREAGLEEVGGPWALGPFVEREVAEVDEGVKGK